MTAPVEWDWPREPGRRHQPDDEPVLDLQVRVSRARRTSSAPAPKCLGTQTMPLPQRSIDRIANGFFFTMVTLAKMVVAAFATVLVLGSIALLVILVEAAMK